MFCPNCGTKLNGNEDFCPNCGTNLSNVKNLNAKQESLSQPKKTKNTKLLIIVIISLLIVALVVFILLFTRKKDNSKYGNISKKTEISYTYTDNNIPKFIDGAFSDKKIENSDDVLKALEDIKETMQFKDISKELKLTSSDENNNVTYYKFNQVYNDIPVYSQNIIVSVDSNKNITGLSGYYIPNIDLDIKPKKTETEIKDIVLKELGENSNISSIELNILADYDKQELVYIVSGYSDTKITEYILNANTGEILNEIDMFDYSNVYSYTGVGMNNQTYTISLEEYTDILDNQKHYKFYDSQRNISVADYRSIGKIASLLVSAVPGTTPITVDINDNKIEVKDEDKEFIQSAVTAMANYEKIYDYYKNVLGRDSYDNKGSKIIINLGVTAKTFTNDDLNNASWCSLTNQMYIGNWNGKSFSASLDVLGHEFTHGVVSFTADFAGAAKEKDKAFETGALNEGYADIIGNLIEGKNWTIAESNEILRSAVNPEEYKNPSSKGGTYYYPDGMLKERTLEQFLKDNDLEDVTDYDNGGVHQNSNVVSHAAYLMYKDGAFSSREEMAKVWYNSLFMLSSYSNFEDSALAVIKSAQNLGLSDASIYKIIKAFQETNMLEDNDYSLEGTVSSGSEKLNNAKIEVYSYEDNSLITTTNTDNNGKYSIKLPTGTYNIKVTLKDFNEFTTTTIIKGDTTLDIELANSNNTDNNNCQGKDCVNLTVYFLQGDDSNKLEKNYETYSVPKGAKADVNNLVNAFNKAFKNISLSTDGKSFYISVNGFEVEFAWYYKDTNKKFDFNSPLTEDTEIEMKLFNGSIDYDSLLDIDGLFNR